MSTRIALALRSALLLSCALLLVTGVRAETGNQFTMPDQGLTLDLGSLEQVEEKPVPEHRRHDSVARAWEARLGASVLEIEYRVLSRNDYELWAPEEVIDVVEMEYRRRETAATVPFYFQDAVHVAGAFGHAPYASIATHARGGDAPRELIVLGGLLELDAYTVEVSCSPPLAEDGRTALYQMLEQGVRFDDDTWDPKWAEEEVEERWRTAFPERVQEQDDLGVLRTPHFLVITNLRAKGGTVKKFGKVMERYYDEIADAFPFEELEGERLMPIYLFKTEDQFIDFLVQRHGYSFELADRTRSITSRDYYATFFESPNDPDYLYGATQLVFAHRLRFRGGGTWFWAGVAEYMEKPENDRKQFRNLAKSDTYTPFIDMMTRREFLVTDEVRGNEVEYIYRQAACVIEFARESKWGKGKFREFVNTFGRLPASSLPSIEQALQSIYGVDLAAFEKEFVEYWKRRR